MPGIKLTSRTAGTTVNKNVYIGSDIKTDTVFTGDSNYQKEIPKESINVTIGVFFDGTNNNRFNINARIAYESMVSGTKLSGEEYKAAYKYAIVARDNKKKDDSFNNGETNINRMEPFYNKGRVGKELKLSVYIEGSGTKDGVKDHIFGLGAAWYSTGIVNLMERMCEIAADEIKSKVGSKKVNTLTVDVFGFSRGATSARMFVDEITKRKGTNLDSVPYKGIRRDKHKYDYGLLGKHLAEKKPKILSVRLVGIYDTVVSYGLPWNHKGNMRTLRLDSISRARHVFHITAADEFRKNFKLTNIHSVASRGEKPYPAKSGLEKSFPGVHADVGGSYRKNLDENKVIRKGTIKVLKEYQQYLINQGWYRSKKEIFIKEDIPYRKKVYSDSMRYGKLVSFRNDLSPDYSYITLQIMAEYAIEKKVDILTAQLALKYYIHSPLLVKVKSELKDYVKGKRGPILFKNSEDREMVKILRYKYFHRSAVESFGIWGNFENGKEKRVINDDTSNL